MLAPLFEKDALLIGSALAPTTAVNTDICKVGLQRGSNESGPFAGVQLHYTFTQSGGTTDSDLTIDTYLSYDGSTIDDDVFHTFDTDGATSAAAFNITRFFLACEPNYGGAAGEANKWYAPIGAAFRQAITRKDGDKTIVLNVWARRFWWNNV